MGKLSILVWVISIQFCLGQSKVLSGNISPNKPVGSNKHNQDSLLLQEKKVEFKPVTISKSNYKVPKLLKSKNRSAGSFFKNTTFYMKANLNAANGKFTKLKIMVSAANLKKVSGEAKVKVEIRKVDHGWSDTSKVLADFNEAQLAFYNRIPEKNKASIGEVVLVKYIPIKEIKSEYIEIPIESINEDEVFIAIGLNSVDEMKESTRGIFRAQRFNSLDMAYENGAFNYPRSYLDTKYLYQENEYFIAPYFELIIK